ncbi:hypothetical protein NHX12_026466 [Muraenolepis orangiensis]|uniref:Uncharacterized protein n=1 Tax=Muraenolepis orangiensis TaxID=630683 RepID=A0A9Q0EK98_9TELE|nr:hypothetical protein NHX12_026466 [Muraenolepis orangiensis]
MSILPTWECHPDMGVSSRHGSMIPTWEYPPDMGVSSRHGTPAPVSRGLLVVDTQQYDRSNLNTNSESPVGDSTTQGAMPLFEGLGSSGEKTAVVIDLGAACTK